MWYPYQIHEISIWYSCDINMKSMWYCWDIHMISIQIFMWYPYDIHTIFMWYPYDIHVISIWYSSDIHMIYDIRMIFTWYPWHTYDIHMKSMWYQWSLLQAMRVYANIEQSKSYENRSWGDVWRLNGLQLSVRVQLHTDVDEERVGIRWGCRRTRIAWCRVSAGRPGYPGCSCYSNSNSCKRWSTFDSSPRAPMSIAWRGPSPRRDMYPFLCVTCTT